MSVDVALVGGGLASSLIALRLTQARPELTLAVLEQEVRLGGSHTWSFHDSDVTAAQLAWLKPLVVRSWPAYDVCFPRLTRHVVSAYHSITSDRLRAVVAQALGTAVQTGNAVTAVRPDAVTFADGRELRAGCVIDGRGMSSAAAFSVGFQKFLGQELRLVRPHGRQFPTLMDARVEQRDGFRFIYVLPLADDLLLVEDTCYSESPTLDRAAARAAIASYVAGLGFEVKGVEREEEGALPIPLGGNIEAFWRAQTPGVACSGMRAALFHPTTGYSLPEAVRLADSLAGLSPLTSASVLALVRERSRQLWRRGRFFRFLNRMLFRAAAPSERYRVLEHFYRLPDDVVQRFYAGSLSFLDRVRLLSGRPPVPVRRAALCVFEPAVGR